MVLGTASWRRTCELIRPWRGSIWRSIIRFTRVFVDSCENARISPRPTGTSRCGRVEHVTLMSTRRLRTPIKLCPTSFKEGWPRSSGWRSLDFSLLFKISVATCSCRCMTPSYSRSPMRISKLHFLRLSLLWRILTLRQGLGWTSNLVNHGEASVSGNLQNRLPVPPLVSSLRLRACIRVLGFSDYSKLRKIPRKASGGILAKKVLTAIHHVWYNNSRR